jgi:hypothetical protein
VVCGGAGFDPNDAGHKIGEETRHLCALQLTAQDDTPLDINPVNLEYALC